MARIRTVKPEFWTDQKTGHLSPQAKCLFIGLLNLSDDYGVVEYRPEEWCVKIFPYDALSTHGVLTTLLAEEILPIGLVAMFAVPDRAEKLLFITNFDKHQVVNRPSKPILPGWEKGDTPRTYAERRGHSHEETLTEHSLSAHGALTRERKGREGSISYANAYSSETSSDTLAEETPKRRKRVSYPPDFEAFWTAFPTDALMSKKAAGLVWSRMTEDVRQLAMSSLPAFRAYCTSKPDYRPVHAVRYLTQERFVGFSEVVSKAAGKVFVAKGTPQWTAWQRVQHSSCVTSAEHRQDGWWFESEWPNGEHSDERKTA